ncbi:MULTISPECIES: methionine ABC transporter permease [Paenibacillus]|uniref:Metal ABC transporter permease n=1 Tax=Paenibacillus campinasensis TaxID=66347 RepID=A0A268EXZ6_9BACL|nr:MULTISPECIES: methionine ABC transporter permease [Paenibacillus]MUG66476.1 methionine ABC transporter permease MetI [Paenibacillus campinasensis]PAD77944.1 metal ABC transporter permease [Paenibacillus campinasensis]PAK52974.1 metal ABC transporter permease [Paenibacillus sp. 7541]
MLGLDFSQVNWNEIGTASLDTLRMLGLSALFSFILGLPIGVILYMAARSTSGWVRFGYGILSFIVNILRSIPYIILIVAMIPITKSIVGVSYGVIGTIPPLVVGAAPFFARLVETALNEVDKGVIEAAQAMGSSTRHIIFRVLLPEARPGLLAAMTITIVTLVSYTAMSGQVGGGGLGNLAIQYGYYRYDTEIMIIAVIAMIVLVQLLQMAGDRLVRRFTRK